jgi:hypothetical protein
MLVMGDRIVWKSYNHDRVRKVFILMRELSPHAGIGVVNVVPNVDMAKIYNIVRSFEGHVSYLITELLNSIKIIPDRIYQKKITVIRLYLNLLIILRSNKAEPIHDNIPLMMYWDPYNKRLWKVVISLATLDPSGFKIQTLIESDKDRDDAIRNLQNGRVFYNSISSTAKHYLYNREIELLSGRKVNDTYLFKIIQQ